MAVTKAKDDSQDKKNGATGRLSGVHEGASGGLAPEGYGLVNQAFGAGGVENAKVDNEGVSQRTPEQDEKRFKEADKFMKSKADFDKKALQAEKDVAEGKETHVLKDAIAEEKEKQNKEAEKKPTAVGANTNLDNPAVAQSAKATVKEEVAEKAAKEDKDKK